jgi:hypothetical protein
MRRIEEERGTCGIAALAMTQDTGPSHLIEFRAEPGESLFNSLESRTQDTATQLVARRNPIYEASVAVLPDTSAQRLDGVSDGLLEIA